MNKEIEKLIENCKKTKEKMINNFKSEFFHCEGDRLKFKTNLNIDLAMQDSFIRGLVRASQVFAEDKENAQ